MKKLENLYFAIARKSKKIMDIVYAEKIKNFRYGYILFPLVKAKDLMIAKMNSVLNEEVEFFYRTIEKNEKYDIIKHFKRKEAKPRQVELYFINFNGWINIFSQNAHFIIFPEHGKSQLHKSVNFHKISFYIYPINIAKVIVFNENYELLENLEIIYKDIPEKEHKLITWTGKESQFLRIYNLETKTYEIIKINEKVEPIFW